MAKEFDPKGKFELFLGGVGRWIFGFIGIMVVILIISAAAGMTGSDDMEQVKLISRFCGMILSAWVTGWLASQKGRSSFVWGAVGFVFSFPAYVILALQSNIEDVDAVPVAPVAPEVPVADHVEVQENPPSDFIRMPCPHCKYEGKIRRDKMPDGPARLRCPKCKNGFQVAGKKGGPDQKQVQTAGAAEKIAGPVVRPPPPVQPAVNSGRKLLLLASAASLVLLLSALAVLYFVPNYKFKHAKELRAGKSIAKIDEAIKTYEGLSTNKLYFLFAEKAEKEIIPATIEKAEVLARHKRTTEAIDLYKKVLARDRSLTSRLLDDVGMLYLEKTEELIDLNPEKAREWGEQGHKYLVSWKYTDEKIETIVSDLEVNMALAKAKVHQATGDYSKALEVLGELSDSQINNPSVMLSIGRLYWLAAEEVEDEEQRKKYLVTSLMTLELAKENWPDNRDIRFELANRYYNLKVFDKALTEYNALLMNSSGDQRCMVLSRVGHIYYQMKDLPKAKDAFQAALAINNRPQDVVMLGRIHLEQKQYEQAKETFLSVATEKGEDAQYNLLMGRVHFCLKEYDQAENCLQKSLSLGGDRYLLEVGEIYRLMGARQKAIELYQQASEADDTVIKHKACSYLGLIYSDMGDPKRSNHYYEKLLSLDPSNSNAALDQIRGDVAVNYYKITGDANQLKTGIQYYQKALIKDPTDAYAYNDLGLAYLSLVKLTKKENTIDKAIKQFEQSIELISEDFPNPILYRNLASSYLSKSLFRAKLRDKSGFRKYLNSAAENYMTAITLAPYEKGSYENLYFTYALLGNKEQAQRVYVEARNMGFEIDINKYK